MKINYLIIYLGLILLTACGDTPPTDYLPVYFLEGYLIVDSPIKDIKIAKSQPVQDTLSYFKYIKEGSDDVVTAKIFIMDKSDISKINKEIILARDTSNLWYCLDKSYHVDTNTVYKIEVIMKNGIKLKSSTNTPNRIYWDKSLKNTLQFPVDTLSSAPSDSISWSRVYKTDWYIITIKALDTTNYGSYGIDINALPNEKNRRIERSFKSNRDFTEQTSLSIIPNNQTAVVWSVFNWFGPQECAVYAPDYNMTKWFLQARTSREVNPLLGSIEGGGGCFGSASVVKDTTFLIKNQK